MAFRHSQSSSTARIAINSLLSVYESISKRNYSLEVTTSSDEIVRFFSDLHPRKTQYPLMRLGSGDGGYLIPNDLEGVHVCISPGFGNLYEFERELIKKNIKSIIIDPEVHHLGADLISVPQWLATVTNQLHQKISLKDLIEFYVPTDSEMILQMDIEGDEWLILESLPIEVLSRFRIAVIEFHSLHLVRFPWFYKRIHEPVMKRMLELFTISHFHVNNGSGTWSLGGTLEYPGTVEITFHRKDRVTRPTSKAILPHVLDEKCDESAPDFDINTFFKRISLSEDFND